ncbi:MAG: hypothetical protein ACHQEM_11705, partial [Chitinophagales bacterium]
MIKKLALCSVGGILGGVVGYFSGGLLAYKFITLEEIAVEEAIEEMSAPESDAEVEKETKRPVKKKTPKNKDNHKMTPISYQDYFKKGNLDELAAPYQSSITEIPEVEPKEAESVAF